MQNRIRVDRLTVPVLPVGGPQHDLEMQVRNVLWGIAGRPDEAKGITLPNLLARSDTVAVMIEMRVVVYEFVVTISRVDSDAAELIVRHAEDDAIVGGDDRCVSRGEDVDRVVLTLATVSTRRERIFDSRRAHASNRNHEVLLPKAFEGRGHSS